jgi:hypothetical protein
MRFLGFLPTGVFLLVHAFFGTLQAADSIGSLPQEGFRVGVTPGEVIFRWNSVADGVAEIRQWPLYTGTGSPQQSLKPVVIWRGPRGTGTASVKRLETAGDRLFFRYSLAPAEAEDRSEPQYVTDFSGLTRRHPEAWANRGPSGKKGVTCVLDQRDAEALGCAQVNRNIDLGELLDVKHPESPVGFEYEGRWFGLRRAAVDRLDHDLSAAAAAGQRVTGILLNNVRKDTPRESPLVHPLTDPNQVPLGPSAFNTATPEGLLHFRAMVHWLVERYTRPEAPFGRLSGLVVGNEIQSHWSWYHMGLADPDRVLGEYLSALRVVDLVGRSLHKDFPVYVSLEHHWMLPASEDSAKGFHGRYALEQIAAHARRAGDFPWHLAFHPYPENLFNPRFWEDRTAPLRMDAPRITFRNLEVLSNFMEQDALRYEGRVRRIALTEQGFHCPDGPDGELLQAAAYALAWKKVAALPGVESFLYHRHVDHPGEFGLRCGLRAHDGSQNVLGVGVPRKIWEVFRAAGTGDEDAAFAFALPVLGMQDWSGMVAARLEPERPQKPAPFPGKRVVQDFVRGLESGRRENLAVVERRRIGPADELPERGVLTHPVAGKPGGWGFSVDLPDGRPILVLGAILNHPQSGGVRMSVAVAGEELWGRELKGGERVDAELDLSRWSGQKVELVFGVDPLRDPGHDIAVWVAPRILAD